MIKFPSIFVKVTVLISVCMSVVSGNARKTNDWNEIEYEGKPWVKNISKPYKIKKGLDNHHVTIWASHGMYYKTAEDQWKWQRPLLFNTREDMFTETIVLPYLIPMLENAGAVVFTPRERDIQTREYIIDNDNNFSNVDGYVGTYREHSNGKQNWRNTPKAGFAAHSGTYYNTENPFIAGTARQTETTKSKDDQSMVFYQPNFAKEGRYAVYVSYQTVEKSTDAAKYVVIHKGQETEINVNQRMGGGTWVYIGTFEFDKGCNSYNCVIATNYSKSKGVVTTDAVRFGGGMGNIERGGMVSGMPRILEGARYYAQWAGMPDKIYNGYGGQDDYKDDINTRSLMSNYMAGGSVFSPSKEGLGVPLELSLAVHSDAGTSSTNDIFGTLTICTTDFNNGKFSSGTSRSMSKDFATMVFDNMYSDMRGTFGRWINRAVWDKNYSETRLPDYPSAIAEILSHENFADMKIGQDPEGKFAIARSLYKSILKFVTSRHGEDYVISPLCPDDFSATIRKKNKVRLSWQPVKDSSEPSADPDGYIVYTAAGTSDFDNGTYVRKPRYDIKVEPGVLYNFKVTAVNKGGESFPTQVLSVCYRPEATRTIMVVDGFSRLASPQVNEYQGFDFNTDAGVVYGQTIGWGDELTGKVITGNTFDYVRSHADAIQSLGKYNIVSCSKNALTKGNVVLDGVDMIDLLCGLERHDGYTHRYYKTFTSDMQTMLSRYLNGGGSLLVSGAYIGSDMLSSSEREFMSSKLHLSCDSVIRSDYDDSVEGMGVNASIYRSLNDTHYAAGNTDILDPVAPAFCAMRYDRGQSACVAYKGDRYSCLSLGFPFECVKSPQDRNAMMKAITGFLLY